MSIMKALLLEKYGEFRYVDVECPVPGAGEVLIRVKACAVCGSDVHGMDGSTGRRQPPIIMGHEAAGIIEQCGEGVTDWKPGERVTFDSTIYCGSCPNCLRGDINLCKYRRVLGVSCDDYRMHGAFAEFIVVPERILYALPEGIEFEQAAMVEPLAVAYHAAAQVTVLPGDNCVIVGAGTIGLLLLQVLRDMGARVGVIDISKDRLETAKALGAEFCANSSEEDALACVSEYAADGVDITYDAVGITSTVDLCAKMTRANGSIVLIGNLSKSVELPLQWVVTRQQKLFGSCASSGEYSKCLEMIASGKVNVNALITRTVPMAEGGEWIRRLYKKEPGLYKIVMIP